MIAALLLWCALSEGVWWQPATLLTCLLTRLASRLSLCDDSSACRACGASAKVCIFVFRHRWIVQGILHFHLTRLCCAGTSCQHWQWASARQSGWLLPVSALWVQHPSGVWQPNYDQPSPAGADLAGLCLAVAYDK